MLAYDAGDGTIAITDVDGGAATPIRVTGSIPLAALQRRRPTLPVATDTALLALDPATGAQRQLLAVAPAAIATSPDVAAEVAAVLPGGEVRRVAIDGAGERTVITVPGAPRTVAWSPDGRTLLVPDAAGDRWHLVMCATGADRRSTTSAGGSIQMGSERPLPGIAGWCC